MHTSTANNQKVKIMTPKCHINGKSFREIYDALPGRSTVKTPKTEFVERIAAVTKRTTQTVRMWLNGSQNPDALAQSVIEKELGIPATDLFPSKHEVN